jgi:hypothetical protein
MDEPIWHGESCGVLAVSFKLLRPGHWADLGGRGRIGHAFQSQDDPGRLIEGPRLYFASEVKTLGGKHWQTDSF